MNCRQITLLLAFVVVFAKGAHAQSFGVEVFNNLMPASGGMAGSEHGCAARLAVRDQRQPGDVDAIQRHPIRTRRSVD